MQGGDGEGGRILILAQRNRCPGHTAYSTTQPKSHVACLIAHFRWALRGAKLPLSDSPLRVAVVIDMPVARSPRSRVVLLSSVAPLPLARSAKAYDDRSTSARVQYGGKGLTAEPAKNCTEIPRVMQKVLAPRTTSHISFRRGGLAVCEQILLLRVSTPISSTKRKLRPPSVDVSLDQLRDAKGCLRRKTSSERGNR